MWVVLKNIRGKKLNYKQIRKAIRTPELKLDRCNSKLLNHLGPEEVVW